MSEASTAVVDPPADMPTGPSAAVPQVADAPSPAPAATPSPETVAMVMQTVFPSFEQMMRKPVRKATIDFLLPQEEGDPLPVKMALEAIDGPAYDALQAQFPPTAVQRAQGQTFDSSKFGPALLARVVKKPDWTVEQWTQLWNNPRWSGGEVSGLFWAANGLCLQGLDVPLSSSG